MLKDEEPLRKSSGESAVKNSIEFVERDLEHISQYGQTEVETAMAET